MIIEIYIRHQQDRGKLTFTLWWIARPSAAKLAHPLNTSDQNVAEIAGVGGNAIDRPIRHVHIAIV